MKILITGATGFTGSHLLKSLINKNYNIVILKRSNSNIGRIRHLLDKVNAYDLDKIDLVSVLKKEKVDLIIHLATNYGKCRESINQIIETNIILPAVLLDTAIKNRLMGFINADTSAKDTYSLYAATKKAFLNILKYYHKENDLKVINLQLEYIYGPDDDDSKFIPYLIKSTIEDKIIDATEGTQKRDFIFIDDVVEAFLNSISLIKKIKSDFLILEIGSGKSISLRELAKLVEEIIGKKSRISWGSLPFRKNEIFESKANIEESQKVLEWYPKYDLRSGLEKTIAWYRGIKNC